jgi:hypothetical protein
MITAHGKQRDGVVTHNERHLEVKHDGQTVGTDMIENEADKLIHHVCQEWERRRPCLA